MKTRSIAMLIGEYFLRNLVWRTGRKLYCWARGDMQNDPRANGEYWLLDKVIEASDGGLVLFDVGANKGDWSMHALDAALQHRRIASLTAFEPCSGTRSMLESRLAQFDTAHVSGLALSSETGTAEFFSSGDGAGTNSLSSISGKSHETVVLTTVDAYLEHSGVSHLSMLKIDAEGFDFDVLLGASSALSSGRIGLVQFEYNWRWLINNKSLRDVFELIDGKPYVLGKLTGASIEFFESWHFELDRYFENNYLLMRHGNPLLRYGKFYKFNESNCAVRSNDATHLDQRG